MPRRRTSPPGEGVPQVQRECTPEHSRNIQDAVDTWLRNVEQRVKESGSSDGQEIGAMHIASGVALLGDKANAREGYRKIAKVCQKYSTVRYLKDATYLVGKIFEHEDKVFVPLISARDPSLLVRLPGKVRNRFGGNARRILLGRLQLCTNLEDPNLDPPWEWNDILEIREIPMNVDAARIDYRDSASPTITIAPDLQKEAGEILALRDSLRSLSEGEQLELLRRKTKAEEELFKSMWQVAEQYYGGK